MFLCPMLQDMDICAVICFKIWIYVLNIWYMEIWQYCNVLCPMQGENKNTCFISICYNLFTAGGVFMHTGCHHQKGGECWSLKIDKFWWWMTKVLQMHWSSILRIYTEFWLLKLIWRLWLFLCIFRIFLKSLDYTHNSHIVDLTPNIVDLMHYTVD